MADDNVHHDGDDQQQQQEKMRLLDLSFVYRGKVFPLSMPAGSTLRELGQQLESATAVAPHTLRLLLPRSPALLPFSDQHGSLPIAQSGIFEGRPIRMMGALPGEIKEVSQEAGRTYERRIIDFADEDKRAKQRMSVGAHSTRKLPQGNYIFCDFRTLHLPGIELHPPAGKAMEIMHKLASDPGIVAIMNKHHWRVGVMTEMAPVGYVGISPKCILGFNKNKGEEVSLRLRTDDLKGFRKYESIKKTLLHELAHMVHSEHDADFYALNKQLNEEAISLDWTKSGGHSLGGFKPLDDEEEDSIDAGAVRISGGQKLGGSEEHIQLGARTAAALAALIRFSTSNDNRTEDNYATGNEIDVIAEGNEVHNQTDLGVASKQEPDPDDCDIRAEPDPDEAQSMEVDESLREQGPSLDEMIRIPEFGFQPDMYNGKADEEVKAQLDRSFSREQRDIILMHSKANQETSTANPDESSSERREAGGMNTFAAMQQDDLSTKSQSEGSKIEMFESSVEDLGLKSMQEYTVMVCQRIQDAIIKLKEEATPSDAAATIQTLFRILRNLKEHPHEAKFKCLRKANAAFQNRIAKFKGAMEVLHAVGFSDGTGNGTESNDYLVLKRNDPVLLWLAQTSLEACMA